GGGGAGGAGKWEEEAGQPADARKQGVLSRGRREGGGGTLSNRKGAGAPGAGGRRGQARGVRWICPLSSAPEGQPNRASSRYPDVPLRGVAAGRIGNPGGGRRLRRQADLRQRFGFAGAAAGRIGLWCKRVSGGAPGASAAGFASSAPGRSSFRPRRVDRARGTIVLPTRRGRGSLVRPHPRGRCPRATAVACRRRVPRQLQSHSGPRSLLPQPQGA